MYHLKYLLYFIFFHLIVGISQLNLYYTDWVNNELQHNCLRTVASIEKPSFSQRIISYCLNELPSKFHSENNNHIPKFTFDQLSKQNVTSQQLYLWSAPIDVIEHYQSYLNELSISMNHSSFGTDIFYNCTLPRFGPQCQYEFVYYHSQYSSLYEMLHDFYRTYIYQPTNLTCYLHLQCYHGSSPICLDWTDICDDKFDCFDSGLDEKYCWQLEINKCNDDEFRCTNGQCIPKSFHEDDKYYPDCLDGSDEPIRYTSLIFNLCQGNEPSFGCEDLRCFYFHRSLTSSCIMNRENLLFKRIFSIKDQSISEKCWSAFKCIIKVLDTKDMFCSELCMDNMCVEIVENSCPEMLYIPSIPYFFGEIYLAYRKRDAFDYAKGKYPLPYLCYNNSRYDDIFINVPMILFNNRICYLLENIEFPPLISTTMRMRYITTLNKLYDILVNYNLNYNSTICNQTNMYQCISSSKCISVYRLKDSTYDCPFGDDEDENLLNNTNILELIKRTHIKCEASNKYIRHNQIRNQICDCGYIEPNWCEDEDLPMNYIRRNISFQTICDEFIELASVLIENRNETDETECQQWECNNIYTRCNGIWNCPNGADEAGCRRSLSIFNCSSQDHLCVSPDTNQFMCLPVDKANDGTIDCLGASDEPILCRYEVYNDEYNDLFHCIKNNTQQCIQPTYLCDNHNHCENGDDEEYCEKNRTTIIDGSICWPFLIQYATDIEKFLCEQFTWNTKHSRIYFSLNGSIQPVADLEENEVFFKLSDHEYQPRCHRGLDLRVWLNNKINPTMNACLCPPSFYGEQCQYQNQRISLTIKFNTSSDSRRTIFVVIISLIDDSDRRIIHSYEQFTYLSIRDCQIKFNIYLLYSTRPKDLTKQYAIHIDFYEQILLNYRGSVLLPVNFPFLPVHRLAFMVHIPPSDNKIQNCFNPQCIHGKCIKYSNNPQNLIFCKCDKGWSGRYCTIKYNCTCAFDSLCIGISANNQSICVCPLNKFGPRCLLINSACQNENNSTTCQNGGQCIPNDVDMISSNRTFTCICSKGYSGERCEIPDNQLMLSFDKEIVLSQSLFIHFIEVINNHEPERRTTFRTILLRQDKVIIHWSLPFHLVFIELQNKIYYLTVFQTIYNRSTTIDKMIHSSDRCPNISELFNETFVQWHLLRRIKYYHLPCQNQSLNLSCFHDSVHFCLCYTFGEKRLANCFNFDHNMTFDCFGQSECENNGQCFQDDRVCPQRSVCMCQPCFYGQRCQFSTSGFGLSLDGIIGYYILPDVTITYQPAIVQFTLALTIIFMVTGLINGILCLITFKNKLVQEVGCGLYLLVASITTLFITIVFGMKFFILLLAQMGTISNRSFLQVQCISLDFILRVGLSLDQWLSACVAIERAMTVIKATRFDKKQSKQTAILVVVILLITIVGSCIHEPISRRLINEQNNDDVNDIKRTWCTFNYSSSSQVYNYIIHICHFLGPFLINLISSVILITKQSRQQAIIHKQRSYKQILREQFQQHKYLLTAPIVLVILAVPRLIITFVSKCMKSNDDAWLFLVGYFISFIPPMLTSVVFLLPSEFYKEEFQKSLQKFRSKIQRRFHLMFQ